MKNHCVNILLECGEGLEQVLISISITLTTDADSNIEDIPPRWYPENDRYDENADGTYTFPGGWPNLWSNERCKSDPMKLTGGPKSVIWTKAAIPETNDP